VVSRVPPGVREAAKGRVRKRVIAVLTVLVLSHEKATHKAKRSSNGCPFMKNTPSQRVLQGVTAQNDGSEQAKASSNAQVLCPL
jgi:hypothetical protein